MSARTSTFAERQPWIAALFNSRSLRLAALTAMFAAAMGVRLLWIEAPGILVEREYTSAIFARTFYFERAPGIEPWRLAIARAIKADQPVLEPPVTDQLVSLIYAIVGKEEVWFSRILTSTFWVIGGIFFLRTTGHLLSPNGSLVATAYYLFVPLGISVSRSFQPDALMMMLFMISLFLITSSFCRPSMATLILAASISGLTLLIRPLVLFSLFGAFGGLLLFFCGFTRRSVSKLLVFALISLALPSIYYGYAMFGAGHMHWKIASSFRPYLYLEAFFWRNWFVIAVDAVGPTALVACLFGVPLLANGPARTLVVSLLAGYIGFGLLFNFHIHTHNYYHVQLVPIAAICIAPPALLLIRQLRQATPYAWLVPILALTGIISVFSILDAKSREHAQSFEHPQIAREIGEIVHHSDRIVFLARHYGLPLQYYGELSGSHWPRSITSPPYTRPGEQRRSVEERFGALERWPDYFVITDFAEFTRHHTDLKAFLERNATLIAESDSYLIYSLEHIDWGRVLSAQSGD